MADSLDITSKKDIELLEKTQKDQISLKAKEVEFTYNRLTLGKGTLYVGKHNFIWVKDSSKKKNKKHICFNDYTKSNIYLDHYEKYRNFFEHLLTKVQCITIDSSKIALHALSTEGGISGEACVYIQLNDQMFEETFNEKEENENEDSDSNDSKDEDQISDVRPIIPEICLIGKTDAITTQIFDAMSNFEMLAENEEDETDSSYANTDHEEEVEDKTEEEMHIKKERKLKTNK